MQEQLVLSVSPAMLRLRSSYGVYLLSTLLPGDDYAKHCESTPYCPCITM